MNKELAKITKASLDLHDRDILTFNIIVDYENGFSQNIGGFALDKWDEKSKTRIGTAYGCEMIRQLLDILQVDDFSEMVNKVIWIIVEGEGINIKPIGIQTLRFDGSKKLLFKNIKDKFL